MAYQSIERGLWGDKKFRTLSPSQPSAQFLWLYLLTGPHTTNLPGLFQIGIGSISDNLKWPYEKTKECVQEIIDSGMAFYDHDSLVMLLPNSILYNYPRNPNVIIGWRKTWDLIPESPLRDFFLYIIGGVISAHIKKLYSTFSTTFPEVLEIHPETHPETHAGCVWACVTSGVSRRFGTLLPKHIPDGFAKPVTVTETVFKKKLTKKSFQNLNQKKTRHESRDLVQALGKLDASWPIDSTLLEMRQKASSESKKVEILDELYE